MSSGPTEAALIAAAETPKAKLPKHLRGLPQSVEPSSVNNAPEDVASSSSNEPSPKRPRLTDHAQHDPTPVPAPPTTTTAADFPRTAGVAPASHSRPQPQTTPTESPGSLDVTTARSREIVASLRSSLDQLFSHVQALERFELDRAEHARSSTELRTELAAAQKRIASLETEVQSSRGEKRKLTKSIGDLRGELIDANAGAEKYKGSMDGCLEELAGCLGVDRGAKDQMELVYAMIDKVNESKR